MKKNKERAVEEKAWKARRGGQGEEGKGGEKKRGGGGGGWNVGARVVVWFSRRATRGKHVG